MVFRQQDLSEAQSPAKRPRTVNQSPAQRQAVDSLVTSQRVTRSHGKAVSCLSSSPGDRDANYIAVEEGSPEEPPVWVTAVPKPKGGAAQQRAPPSLSKPPLAAGKPRAATSLPTGDIKV